MSPLVNFGLGKKIFCKFENFTSRTVGFLLLMVQSSFFSGISRFSWRVLPAIEQGLQPPLGEPGMTGAKIDDWTDGRTNGAGAR